MRFVASSRGAADIQVHVIVLLAGLWSAGCPYDADSENWRAPEGCTEGATRECPCDEGADGVATCGDNGRWGPCDGCEAGSSDGTATSGTGGSAANGSTGAGAAEPGGLRCPNSETAFMCELDFGSADCNDCLEFLCAEAEACQSDSSCCELAACGRANCPTATGSALTDCLEAAGCELDLTSPFLMLQTEAFADNGACVEECAP